jgi:hypothetical protein
LITVNLSVSAVGVRQKDIFSDYDMRQAAVQIAALYPHLAKKKILVDMMFITNLDIRPPFKFRPQGQIKPDHDSLVVRFNLVQDIL